MKKLTIEIEGDEGWIVEQTHRGISFGKGFNTFVASNGFRLSSSINPEAKIDKLYVRGSTESDDTKRFKILDDVWLSRLIIAVREYNLANAGEGEK